MKTASVAFVRTQGNALCVCVRVCVCVCVCVAGRGGVDLISLGVTSYRTYLTWVTVSAQTLLLAPLRSFPGSRCRRSGYQGGIMLGATPHCVWLQISLRLQPVTQVLVGKDKERDRKGSRDSQSALRYPKARRQVGPRGPQDLPCPGPSSSGLRGDAAPEHEAALS